MGTLDIAELRCTGRHGAYPGEQDAARTFLVDLSVAGEVGADEVATVAAIARRVVGGEPHALLERVAAEIGRAILAERATVDHVTVRVAKPDPPGIDAASEAVSLTLARPR
ncbi:MAG TPA: dihydroneopterin aldolase [Candidatus Limnocylindria bacterium]|nr:dihydroneopterin aldolase [Candidatus Limnocylindria bacterium]